MADTEQSEAPPARPTPFARNATGLVREIRIRDAMILNVLIQAQDQRIVDAQRPEELPIDLAAELHIRGPDAVAVACRRLLAELGVDEDAAAGPAEAPRAGQSR
jgi:hypothetical protein